MPSWAVPAREGMRVREGTGVTRKTAASAGACVEERGGGAAAVAA